MRQLRRFQHSIVLLLLICCIFCQTQNLIYPSLESFTTYHYSHTALQTIENATFISIDTLTCDVSDFPQATQENQIVLAFDLTCYADEIADLIAELDYSAILIVLDSMYFEMRLENFFKGDSQTIPMFHSADDTIDWLAAERITITEIEDSTVFDSTGFKVQVGIMGLVAGIIAILKCKEAFSRLWTYKQRATGRIIPGTVVLFAEIINSIVLLIYAINPYGVLGFSPWILTYTLVRTVTSCSLATTFLMWASFVYVVEKTGESRCSCCFNLTKLFVTLSFVTNIFMNVNVGTVNIGIEGVASALIAIIEILFSCTASLWIAVLFIINKRKVLRVMKSTSKKAVRNEYKQKQMKESATNLAKSSVFLILHVLTFVGVILGLAGFGTPILIWYCLYFGMIFPNLAGYYQVLSVPRHRRRKSTKGRESSP